MAEYIEREAIIKEITSVKWQTSTDSIYAVQIAICTPAADVAPVRHGHWVETPGKIPYCSECGFYSEDADDGHGNYCPHCGVAMDLGV